MHEFSRGPYRTAVGEDEMLLEVQVALHKSSGSAYEKIDRRVGDWAVVAAGACLVLESDGRIERAGIALAAVGAEIVSTEAQARLIGELPSVDVLSQAAKLAAAACSPASDQRGSAEYKRHAAAVLTRRALERAAKRATGKAGGPTDGLEQGAN
jgi:aerobic carbon-monoxide dehydrogenase medium subunit